MRSHCFMPHLTAQPAVAPTSIQLVLTAHSYSETHGFVSSAFYFTCRLAHTHTRISVIPIKLARRYVCLFRFRFQWFITHIFLCARVCARKAYTYTLNICKQYA